MGKYIVTYSGVPHVTSELLPMQPNTLAAIKRVWATSRAWSRVSAFTAHEPDGLQISLVRRLLAHTFYNPKLGIKLEWERQGPTNLQDIVAEVERGLESDDDLIQQWFGASDVLRLLRSATSFEEMVDRVECVCGGFETDERLRGIVESVLGTQEAEQVGAGRP
jgi:hypothetical protein